VSISIQSLILKKKKKVVFSIGIMEIIIFAEKKYNVGIRLVRELLVEKD
jgi:hypothetical protein